MTGHDTNVRVAHTGGSFLSLLAVLFIGLKLAEVGVVASWPWRWVLAPVWIPWALLALVAAVFGAVLLRRRIRLALRRRARRRQAEADARNPAVQRWEREAALARDRQATRPLFRMPSTRELMLRQGIAARDVTLIHRDTGDAVVESPRLPERLVISEVELYAHPAGPEAAILDAIDNAHAAAARDRDERP